MISTIETKNDNKRLILSIIIMMLIYFFLFIIIGILGIRQKPESPKVITVRLQDKIIEEVISMSETEQKELTRQISRNQARQQRQNNTQQTNTQSISSATTEHVTSQISTEQIQQQNQTNQSSIASTNNTSTTVIDQQSIIERTVNQQNQNARDIENNFFGNQSSSVQAQSGNNFDYLLQNLLTNTGGDTGTNTSNSNNNSGTGNNDGINWRNSSSTRTLIYKTEITVPEEFRNTGLIYSMRIAFSVNSDGLITDAHTLISTGNATLDNTIIAQFRRWKFNKIEQNIVSYGEIPVRITY